MTCGRGAVHRYSLADYLGRSLVADLGAAARAWISTTPEAIEGRSKPMAVLGL